MQLAYARAVRSGLIVGITLALSLSGAWLGAASLSRARAEDRIDFLINALRTSSNFRVRMQAALSLGTTRSDRARVVDALAVALTDDNPAVRTAAAVAFERLGDPSTIPLLQDAKRDSNPKVKRALQYAIDTLSHERKTDDGDGRYFVHIGLPGSKVTTINGTMLSRLRQFLEGEVRQIPGVSHASADDKKRVDTDGLTGFYLDSSVVLVERLEDGRIRAQVSLIVGSYPERVIRAMLSGAATGQLELTDASVEQLVQAAFRGALRGLPDAMQSSSLHASR